MTYDFNNFRIIATYRGEKPAAWGNGENWNHYKITVVNTQNKLRTGFDFWASIANPDLSSRYDVLNAFRCFVDDALCGDMTFHDFCMEFGYDEDSRQAERTWKACKKSAEKLTRIYDGDLYDLINSLEDYA